MTGFSRRTVVAFLAVALAGGAAVAASPAREAAPVAPAVTLEQDRSRPDSVRLVARWRLVCDARGCADSTLVTWTVGGVARPARALRGTIDSVRVAAPPWGDSLRVVVTVAAVRRGRVSPSSAPATFVVRTPDAAPPAPDSVRVDTLALALAAERDSFPTIVVRDSLGRNGATDYPLHVPILLCAMQRNRYTGAVRMLGGSTDDGDRECARALQSFAAERDG